MSSGSSNDQAAGLKRTSATVANELAREIKRLRTAAGLSQRELAASICYSRQYVSMAEWEDSGLPSLALVSAIDEALGANGALTAMRAKVQFGQRAVGVLEPPGGLPPTSRLAPSKAPLTLDQPFEDEPDDFTDVLERVRRLSRSINPDVIRALQEGTRACIDNYKSLDSSQLVARLVKQRRFVAKLIDECNHPEHRRILFEVAGQTSGLLGYIMIGRGGFALARVYCLEASQLSDFAGDTNLRAWVSGTQSFCEYYAGNYIDALRYAQEGLAFAQSGPQSARLLINGVARALAKLGDGEAVGRAVAEAHELVSRSEASSGTSTSITLESYNAVQLAGNAATAYLSLGQPDKVEVYVRLALPDMSSSRPSLGRSLVMADLAHSKMLTKGSDMDQAIALMTEALDLPSNQPMLSLQQRASEFVHEAIERWGNMTQLLAVRDTLSRLAER